MRKSGARGKGQAPVRAEDSSSDPGRKTAAVSGFVDVVRRRSGGAGPLAARLGLRSGLLSIVFFSLLVHSTYIANGFVWLDHGDLEMGRAVVPLDQIGRALFARFGETGFYRPVVTFSFSLDRALYGAWSPGFHLTNVILHLLVTAATYSFVRSFFRLPRQPALWAALIVAVHPLSWLPVGAIAYRPELLATLFSLLALVCYAAARHETGSRRAAWVCVAALGAALLSKEAAVVWFVGSVVVWEWTHWRERAEVRGLAQQKLLIGSLLAVLTLYFALRHRAVGGGWHLAAPDLTLNEAVGTRLAVLGERMLEWVRPLVPSLSDAVTPTRVLDLSALLPLCAILALTRFAWRRGSEMRLICLFLGVALFPAGNVVPLPRFSSPHYGYFAAIGVAAAAGWWLRPGTRVLDRRLRTALAVAWIAIAAGATFQGGFAFRDDETLFAPQVASDPHFREGHFYLGYRAHQVDGDLVAAAEAYGAALDAPASVLAYVDLPSLYVNYAAVRYGQGRYHEAEELLHEAQSIASHRLRFLILYQRALIAERLNDDEKVVSLLGHHPETRRWQQPSQLLRRASARLLR